MTTFTTSKTIEELNGILQLQKANLAQGLSQLEIQTQGFVTVSHSLDDLLKLNQIEQHLIMKNEEQVVGYLLAMTKKSRNDIPVLIPMFQLFDKIKYGEKLVSDYNYLVVGQVCIHKNYRGLGLFDQSYAAYKSLFQHKYDFAITEISVNNTRSINAHKRVGFVELHQYTDTNNIAWSVVIWDWK